MAKRCVVAALGAPLAFASATTVLGRKGTATCVSLWIRFRIRGSATPQSAGDAGQLGCCRPSNPRPCALAPRGRILIAGREQNLSKIRPVATSPSWRQDPHIRYHLG
jgi:hypothetical protein